MSSNIDFDGLILALELKGFRTHNHSQPCSDNYNDFVASDMITSLTEIASQPE